ncbi:hypothetical protein Pelo_6581 [Pelomyxa schiedti]|nr:hypothetical protein Pelo_6581 [Pelomyxa schiedti]
MTSQCPISSPIRLLESLVVVSTEERLGTPQPSSASLLFVTGLHAVDAKNWPKAQETLTKAMVEAEKPFAPKTDLALALLGLGYMMASSPAQDLTKALQAYKASLTLWEQVHGKHSPHLAPLIFDVGVLTASVGNYALAVKILQRSVNLWKKAPTEVSVSPSPGEEPLTLDVVEKHLEYLKEAVAQQGGAAPPPGSPASTGAPPVTTPATPTQSPTATATQPVSPPASTPVSSPATPTTASSTSSSSRHSSSGHKHSHTHKSHH